MVREKIHSAQIVCLLYNLQGWKVWKLQPATKSIFEEQERFS